MNNFLQTIAMQSLVKDDVNPGKFYVKMETGGFGEQFAKFEVGGQEMNILVTS